MPPGQYLFAGFINQLFAGPQYFMLRLFTIILSALTSVNIYRIGRENFSTSVGAIAGYSSIFSLTFIFHSWTFYPTTLVTCLFSFCIVHFFRVIRSPNWMDGFLTAFFLGLSILTRTEMIICLPILLFWFFLLRGVNRETLKTACLLFTGVLLIVACWTIRNYAVCKKTVIISSNGPVNFFIGNNPLQRGSYLPPLASGREKKSYLLSGIIYDLKHPGWFVEFYKKKLKICWSVSAREHPMQFLRNKGVNSAVTLFNDSFKTCRLHAFLHDRQMDFFYHLSIFIYDWSIDAFWIFVLLGIFCSHLTWRKSYLLIILCLDCLHQILIKI